MERSTRFFELIQILRAASRPVRAVDLAERLEVSVRTVYRDIAALQSMRTPIEGEPGIGYVMRAGYDLPALNFDAEEIEALQVGLALLTRTGDSALQRAASRVMGKIEALHDDVDWLQVSPWGAPADDPAKGCISKARLRNAIRDEQRIEITYKDEADIETKRTVRPIALIYLIECTILAAWCELRRDFRHFRCDRIWHCDWLVSDFKGQSATLREHWMAQREEPGAMEAGTVEGSQGLHP